jgi:hypothetical protein
VLPYVDKREREYYGLRDQTSIAAAYNEILDFYSEGQVDA